MPKLLGDRTRNEDDGFERDGARVTLEVVPGEGVLEVFEGYLVELPILLVGDVLGLTVAQSVVIRVGSSMSKCHSPSPERSLAVQLNPFIDGHLLGGNWLLFLFLLLGSVFHSSFLIVRLLCGLFLFLQFRLLGDWNIFFTLSEEIDRERCRKCGMLRNEIPNVLFFKVLDGILFQDKGNLGTTLESVTTGIRVYFKRRLIGVAGEDVLDRVRVLSGGGRERRDVDLIRNEERAVEAETECTNEIAAAALVAFGLENKSMDLLPCFLFHQIPLARNSDVPDFASVPRLVSSSWGVMPMPVSAPT